MPQSVASLTEDSRVIIYDCNMFIIEATGVISEAKAKLVDWSTKLDIFLSNMKMNLNICPSENALI